jgi:arylsulfatase
VTTRPNVIVVVLDDIGFGQFGCYGSSIETPAIDALATEGLRYTNFHTTGICSSTRASLLVGRNHHAVGIGTVIDFANGQPGYTGRLPPDARTLAEVLRDEGYGTYCVGKWHLAAPGEQSAAGPYDTWPRGRGFDRFYGFLGGATSQWEPDLCEDESFVRPPRTPAEGYHLSEDLVDHAIAMVEDHRRSADDRPWFLWLAFGAGHDPHHVARQHIEPYRGRFDHGWDSERSRVFARQQRDAIVPAGALLPPRNPGMHAWNELDADRQRLFARMQEVFAGFLTHTDLQIGRLVAHLREADALDDTLVVVVSDNGASAEGGADGLVGTSNPMFVAQLVTEAVATDGIPDRVVAQMRFDDEGYPVYLAEDVAAMLEHLDEMGGPGTHGHYPQGWAAAGNTPYRRYKGNMHYGGTKDPFVVRFPRAIPDPGGLRTQFHHAVDIYPTVLAVAGVDPGAGRTGTRRVDGVDMTYSFAAPGAPSPRGTQYFAMYGHRGLYHEGWKAVTYHDRGTSYDDDVWELYDTTSDPTEAHDLADAMPEKVADLVERWYGEAARNQVLPLDDAPVLDIRFSPGPRSLYDYPEVRALSGFARPDLLTTSFRVHVDVRMTDRDAGVLIANGTSASGQVLHVRDRKVTFEWWSGRQRLEITGDVDGRTRTVGVIVDRAGNRVALLVDGDEVDASALPAPLSTEEIGTMDLGRDPAPRVSDAYDDDFAFSGVIARVRIVTDDVEVYDADSEQVYRTAQREQ